MARRKQNYIKGSFTHRRTEGDYMGVLLDTVTLGDWRDVVTATVAAAKAGDTSARTWLAHYLVGKPKMDAPAPLTVVVQQLSGANPLAERLARPHISRIEYPSIHGDDDWKDDITDRITAELQALEAQNSSAVESCENADNTRAAGTSTPLQAVKLAK